MRLPDVRAEVRRNLAQHYIALKISPALDRRLFRQLLVRKGRPGDRKLQQIAASISAHLLRSYKLPRAEAGACSLAVIDEYGHRLRDIAEALALASEMSPEEAAVLAVAELRGIKNIKGLVAQKPDFALMLMAPNIIFLVFSKVKRFRRKARGVRDKELFAFAKKIIGIGRDALQAVPTRHWARQLAKSTEQLETEWLKETRMFK